MKVGLFIPCYIDAFFPEVGIATVELFDKLGIEWEYPLNQTCCGQPMATNGCQDEAMAAERLFVENFQEFEYIIGPSGSCVHHIRENFDAIGQTEIVKQVRSRTYDLVEFLHDIVQVKELPWAEFPHKIGLHNSCSSLRGIGHAQPSELMLPFFSKTVNLLEKVKGIELITPDRPDECCGFGGTFAIFEEAVSAQMGYDKVTDHLRNGAEYIVSADMTCLMHQKGIIEHCNLNLKVIHIAQVLNGGKL